MRHTCTTCRFCNGEDEYESCENCETISVDEFSNWKPQKITNADKNRSMTDEELDKFLGEVQWDVANYCGGVTQKQEYPVPEQMGAWLEWLKEEVSE